MKWETQNDTIIVEPEKDSGVTPAGIHIPSGADIGPLRGKIVAAPGLFDEYVGKTLLYRATGQYAFEYEGRKLAQVPKVSVIAVILEP